MKLTSLLLALSFSSIAMAEMPSIPSVPDTKAVQTNGASAMNNGMAAAKEAGAKLLVNVNTATKEELQKVPGLGPAKADAIIAGRPYNSVKDLTKVKGIKEGLLTKIKPYITTK